MPPHACTLHCHRYYSDLLFLCLKEERSYDRVPNFTVSSPRLLASTHVMLVTLWNSPRHTPQAPRTSPTPSLPQTGRRRAAPHWDWTQRVHFHPQRVQEQEAAVARQQGARARPAATGVCVWQGGQFAACLPHGVGRGTQPQSQRWGPGGGERRPTKHQRCCFLQPTPLTRCPVTCAWSRGGAWLSSTWVSERAAAKRGRGDCRMPCSPPHTHGPKKPHGRRV